MSANPETARRIEAVVADLDGTLVRQDLTVSPATLDSLRALRNAGIPLVIATGRTPQGVAELDSLKQHAQVAVCCSGSIGQAAERTLWQDELGPDAIAHVVAEAVSCQAGVAGFDGRTWWLTEGYARLCPPGGYGAQSAVVSAATLSRTPLVTMSALHQDGVALAALARGLDGAVGVGLSRVAGLDILDVTSRYVDKGAGVLRALQVIGADPAAVVSFGDMPNDIPMFAVTGRAYAVGCDRPEVAEAVDEVLAPVDRDGFASQIAALAAEGLRIA